MTTHFAPQPEPTGVCPHDGQPSPHQSPRHHDALCGPCVSRATDAAGRAVALFNADFGGGFRAQHDDDSTTCESVTSSNTVYIDGEPFYADEARFGGIVVRPETARPAPR